MSIEERLTRIEWMIQQLGLGQMGTDLLEEYEQKQEALK